MALHPEPIGLVPEETARIARAALAKGNPYLSLRDELGVFSTDAQFAERICSPRGGSPQKHPGAWRSSWYRGAAAAVCGESERAPGGGGGAQPP
jgi:hypothetical protein